MDDRVYNEQVEKIRKQHRDKMDANYQGYADRRKALIEEYEARMTELDEKRKAAGDGKSG